MFRRQSPLIGYLLPVALAAFLFPLQASAQKPKETVAVNAPLTLSLTSDASVVSACTSGNAPRVSLNARAISPGGYPIRYRWTTTAGVISGDGPVVSWDLAGLAPGYHKASVDIQTSGAEGECQAFSSVNVLVNPCPPLRPVCPNIEIICPTNIAIDQPLTFSFRSSGGTPAITPVYNWSVSAGTIIEGQGTNTIKVDTKGLGGETIRAALSMGGYTIDCSASCAVSIPIPKLSSRKFDEFPDISYNDEKARLDNYGIELQNDPTSTAYVIVYPGRTSKRGDVQNHASRIVDYMVNSRALDARRIVTLVGGARNELWVELWIAPQGATPPNP